MNTGTTDYKRAFELLHEKHGNCLEKVAALQKKNATLQKKIAQLLGTTVDDRDVEKQMNQGRGSDVS